MPKKLKNKFTKMLTSLSANKKLQKLRPYAPAIIIVLGFAVVGIILSVSSRAAPFAVNQEAESGTLGGNATTKTDSSGNVSGNGYVSFGSGSPSPTPTPPSGPSPSGEAMPNGDLPGWRLLVNDDFTKDAAEGSMVNDCDPGKIVYTGASGTQWRSYPSCWEPSTSASPYRSDYASVKNGMLYYRLTNSSTGTTSNNLSPLVNGNSQYQIYGRYAYRFKAEQALGAYYMVPMLWAAINDEPPPARWKGGEYDWPEGTLDQTIVGFHHQVGPADTQEYFDSQGARYTDWHTYVIEWMPGRVNYILDGQTLLSTTGGVSNVDMRLQLQMTTVAASGGESNVTFDWVAIWAYQP